MTPERLKEIVESVNSEGKSHYDVFFRFVLRHTLSHSLIPSLNGASLFGRISVTNKSNAEYVIGRNDWAQPAHMKLSYVNIRIYEAFCIRI